MKKNARHAETVKSQLVTALFTGYEFSVKFV
jgi:hypothetical protein